jgi:hypothetical protein
MLVILFFVALWNFDLHSILRVKQLSQNAGDSAVVMAARWQGITLNLVGDLNLMKAVALAGGNQTTVDAIDDVQKRLCFVGPMIAVMASQQAAKNNRIYANPKFDLIAMQAQRVRNDYPIVYTNPPYNGAWQEYADMLDMVASDGVAAEPLNPDFYADYNGYHLLLDPDFYYAVAAPDRCWLARNARSAWNAASANGIRDYSDWPPLPTFTREYVNCEFYSPRLTRTETRLTDLVDLSTIRSMLASRQLGALPPNPQLTNVIAWYCYNGSWTDWAAMSTTGPYPFPLTGTLLPESDYAGADAFLGVQATAHRLTPGPGGTDTNSTICTWTAAAKPFGYLGPPSNKTRPDSQGLVLPAFRDARLIPLDACSGDAGGGYDIDWVRHKHFHLPVYMQNGSTSAPRCWFCNQIVRWESDPWFESDANLTWVTPGWENNPANCPPPPPGGPGGGGGGGRRRGH